jgi:PspA-Associated protein
MIARILGEGQWEVPDDSIGGLNELDAAVEAAVEGGDEQIFSRTLAALLDAVRTAGSPLPPDALVDSDLILPRSDSTIEEVRDLLSDDGLIPG